MHIAGDSSTTESYPSVRLEYKRGGGGFFLTMSLILTVRLIQSVMHIEKSQDSKGSKYNSQELEGKQGMRVSSTKVQALSSDSLEVGAALPSLQASRVAAT